MIILAADTTSPSGSVAVLKKENILAECNLEAGLSHSEKLLPAVNFLLHHLDLDIKDIEGYAIAAGPGSFTGIRVGMSTFKSLAKASSSPIVPVSSLESLACKLRHSQARLLCPVMDAKKGEIYAALYESNGQELKEVIQQGVYSPDRFFSLLPSRRILVFIGTGALLLRHKIKEYFGDKARFSSRTKFIASEVGFLGFQLFQAGKGKKADEILPFYLRKSEAEIKLK